MTRFLSETGFGIGYGLMLLGVILLLDGFALDAWLHANDPDLAAEEGVFALDNPGHALVFVGLSVTILGACVGPCTRWVLPGRSALIALVVPAAALGVALGGSAGFAAALDSWSHEEAEHAHEPAAQVASAPQADDSAAADHGHPEASDETAGGHAASSFVLDENLGTVALAESTMHMPAVTQEVTAENLRFAEQFLADVRANTEKYKDVNAALADGYTRITPDIPLIGAHFWHNGYEGMDPAHPSILLYQDDGAGGWELAGVSFSLPKTLGDDAPPESELGRLAGWHYHSNLCFLAGGNVTLASDQAHCAGVFAAETGWLLHVWAWKDSPEGVFDHANSLMQ